MKGLYRNEEKKKKDTFFAKKVAENEFFNYKNEEKKKMKIP